MRRLIRRVAVGIGTTRPADAAVSVALAAPVRADRSVPVALAAADRRPDASVSVALAAGVAADRSVPVALAAADRRPDALVPVGLRVRPGRPDIARTLGLRTVRPAHAGPIPRPAPPADYDPGEPEAIVYDPDAGYLPPYFGTPLAIVFDWRPGTPRPHPYPMDVRRRVPLRAWSRPERRLDRAVAVALWHGVARTARLRPRGDRRIRPGVEIEIEGRRWIIPWRLGYLMLHDIDLLRVSDGVRIPFSAGSLHAEVDAWADVLTATLHGDDAMDLLGVDGPVELALWVDGVQWRVIVDPAATTEELRHGARSVSLRALSLSALLAVPHVEPADFLEVDERTIEQLVDQELARAGVGWSATWAVGRPGEPSVSWLVPAGAWQYQGLDAAGAIAQVAAAVRATVRPSRTARALTIRPRYPVPPWAYAEATPVLTVQSGLWRGLGKRDRRAEQANAVWVQGGAVGGVLGRVLRTGSAGDRLPARWLETHDLLTHVDALRERGIQELAAQAATSGAATIELPFDGSGGDWPLVEVGDLLRIEGVPTHGVVLDTALSVEVSMRLSERSVSVSQTVGLGEGHAGAVRRLRRALGSDPVRWHGVIAAAHSDGTVTVEDAAGGRQRVIGSGEVGTAVWVWAGRVEGAAPAMVAAELSV